MGDAVELRQLFRIGKSDGSHGTPVQRTVGPKDPAAEGLGQLPQAVSPRLHRYAGQKVAVDDRHPAFLQNAAHRTFARSGLTGQTYHKHRHRFLLYKLIT